MFSKQAEIDQRIAEQRVYKAKMGPSEVDLCDHCKGKASADCRVHGIAAANARQNAFLRDYDKRYPNG